MNKEKRVETYNNWAFCVNNTHLTGKMPPTIDGHVKVVEDQKYLTKVFK